MGRERDDVLPPSLSVGNIHGQDVKACCSITAIEHLAFIRTYSGASPNLQADDSGDAVGASNSEGSAIYVADVEKLRGTSGTGY
jgi:hypothetical protein